MAKKKTKATTKKKVVKKSSTRKPTGAKTSRAASAKKVAAKKATKKTADKATRKRGKSTAETGARAAATRKTTSRGGAAPCAPQAENNTNKVPKAKKTNYLNKRDLEQFRRLLLEKRTELVGDLSAMQDQALRDNRRDAAGDLSSMPIHMADLGTDNYEKEFTLGLLEGERTLLREIDEALERIGNGTYGVCEGTGKPIGKARLKARPWAKYCYEYMLAREKGQPNDGL